jgi:hypothetical protein
MLQIMGLTLAEDYDEASDPCEIMGLGTFLRFYKPGALHRRDHLGDRHPANELEWWLPDQPLEERRDYYHAHGEAKGPAWAHANKDLREDYHRHKRFADGDLHFMGLFVTATVKAAGTRQELRTAGLWGIDSDCGPEYRREIGRDELAEMGRVLRECGAGKRQITRAIAQAIATL